MAVQTICLKGNKGHHDEHLAAGTIKPGHLLQVNSDNAVVVHSVYGGRAGRMFAKEDALQGNIITTSYSSGDLVFTYQALPGDKVNARVPAGAVAIVIGDKLCSNGDGTLVKAVFLGNNILYSNTAAATALVGNVIGANTDTAFSLSYTIPANSLAAGDILRIRGQGLVVAAANTDTLTIKVKIGSTTIATSPAPDTVTNDIFAFDIDVVIRTIGATGTYVAGGWMFMGTPAAAAGAADISSGSFVGSTAINTLTTNAITVTANWSVADAGDSARLDILSVELLRGLSANQEVLAVAAEAVDNSAGVAEAMLAARMI